MLKKFRVYYTDGRKRSRHPLDRSVRRAGRRRGYWSQETFQSLAEAITYANRRHLDADIYEGDTLRGKWDAVFGLRRV